MPERINIRIDDEMVKELEEYMEKHGFDKKSSAIRDMMDTAYFYRVAAKGFVENERNLQEVEEQLDQATDEDRIQYYEEKAEEFKQKASNYLQKFSVRDKERRADIGEGECPVCETKKQKWKESGNLAKHIASKDTDHRKWMKARNLDDTSEIIEWLNERKSGNKPLRNLLWNHFKYRERNL